MSNRKRPPLDTPEERIRHATEQCRQATREAHEQCQDLKAAAADVRAAIAEAGTFVQETIEAEVTRQFEAAAPKLQAALGRAVEHTIAEFDRFSAILRGTEPGDNKPSIEQLVTARAAARSTPAPPPPGTFPATLPCPRCGAPNNGHTPQSPGGDVPTPGEISLCAGCGAISVFDFDPSTVALILRSPTRTEAAELAKTKDAFNRNHHPRQEDTIR